MSMSGSPFSNQTRQDETLTTQSVGFSEVGGNASSLNLNTKGRGQTITLTDNGATAAGMAVADAGLRAAVASLDLADSANKRTTDLAGDYITQGSSLLRDVAGKLGSASSDLADISNAAINLGGDALYYGNNVANAGLDYAQAAYGSALDFASGALDKALKQSNAATESASSLAAGVAQRSTTTDAERVSTIAGYAIAAAAAAIILPLIFKGAR